MRKIKNIVDTFPYQRNVCPDKLDLRDRPYRPAIALQPPQSFIPKFVLPVLNQLETNACTGFALANVVNHLLIKSGRAKEAPVSPFMLYSMARRYDAFKDTEQDKDTGSSLRAAMKGWFKHGACRHKLWSGFDTPAATNDATDWWLEASKRPLGAYYRVDSRSISDMHVALNETGILYASAICHDGWIKPSSTKLKKNEFCVIPSHDASPDLGGHAFVMIGYNQRGFLIQNSWGAGWATGGHAILAYEDWLANAMDCWVPQLGVVTDEHRAVSVAPSLRLAEGNVKLASNEVLRNHELSPFIIDMENNGRLSSSGEFRTSEDDVKLLVTFHAQEARKRWNLKESEPLDVAVYAHGGLTSEKDAAETAAKWIPALYDAHIFPIFFMWETDLWSTLKNRFEDLVKDVPRETDAARGMIGKFWNKRLERFLARMGTQIWGEMKQNAAAISSREPVAGKESGARILYKASQASPAAKNIRLHLIGHSAGSIAHSYLIKELAQYDWSFDSVNFMAPAVTVQTFVDAVVPAIKSGKVKRYHQFHLSDTAEQQDATCRPILGYGRSLLYLVCESFEGGETTPILGMEKYFNQYIGTATNVQGFSAPTPSSASSTHGGFDDDVTTMNKIIELIKQ